MVASNFQEETFVFSQDSLNAAELRGVGIQCYLTKGHKKPMIMGRDSPRNHQPYVSIRISIIKILQMKIGHQMAAI